MRRSDVRRSDVEFREPRRSTGYVDEREVRREDEEASVSSVDRAFGS